MKPFNLEEAKAGKPLVTRDGRSAKFIAHLPSALSNWQVVAYVSNAGAVASYNEAGLCNGANTIDLFMASEKKTVWVNVYANGFACSWESKERADRFKQRERVSCIEVTYEEGVFV